MSPIMYNHSTKHPSIKCIVEFIALCHVTKYIFYLVLIRYADNRSAKILYVLLC